MPVCLKCGEPVPVNEEGIAPVYCDRCAGRAIARARRGMRTGTMRDFPVTTALVAMNVAVFAGMVLTGGSLMGFSGPELVRWGANFTPSTLGNGEYWRLLTSAFVHGGFIHLAFNMWCLWSLGQLCERLYGSWSTAAIYILTGIGGSLLSIASAPIRLSVGASGAIFGIAGALIAGLKFGNLSIGAGERRSLLGSMVFFVGFNFFIGAAGNIDNMAHLGGFVSGLIMGLPLALSLNASRNASSTNRIFKAATLAITALLLAGAGIGLVQTKGQSSRQLVAKDRVMQRVRSALQQQDYATAIRLLEEAAVANPGDAQPQALLGYAYESAGQREKAIEAYRKALELDPNLSRVQEALSELQKEEPSTETPPK